MTSDAGGLNRRAFLTTVATSSTGMLAGCPGCATSYPSYDDRLRVTIERVRERSGSFLVTFRVVQLGPEDFTGESARERFQTSYEDVSVYVYDSARTELASASLGDYEAGTAETVQIETGEFPFVYTAAADVVDVDRDDCYFAETGAPVKGYVGQFDTPVVVANVPTGIERDAESGTSGHHWTTLYHREHHDSLPPDAAAFQQTKCLQRAARQVDTIPTPDLSTLPEAATWYTEPIPEPTVERSHRITVNRVDAYDDGHADQFRTQGATIEFRSLPARVREAVLGDRSVGWVSGSEFLELANGMSDRKVTTVDDLPPCSERHVTCDDDRGVKCRNGTSTFGGEFWKSVWYFTTYDGVEYVVVPHASERWREPGASTPAPCTDRRDESFSITVYDSAERYRGLGSARTGAEVPTVLETVLENAKARDPDNPSYYSESVEKSRWVDAVATLEANATGEIPDCEWSNVDCARNPNVNCGEGSREAFYVVDIGDESWWYTLGYHWSGVEEIDTGD